jgi:hypothetical protein
VAVRLAGRLMSIVRASSVPAVSLLIVDCFLVAPNGPVLFRQDHDRALLGPADRAAQRFACGVPPFPLFPQAACALAAAQSDDDPRPRH